jgi:hypothetical protein
MLILFRKTTKYSNSQADLGIGSGEPYSLTPALLRAILNEAKPLGHHTQKDTLNLGFGFLYYSLVRFLRPAHIAVIGSGYGFSVVCLALGCKDNRYGKVSFVDPSYTLLKNGPFQTVGGAGKWKNPDEVHQHFQQFGVAERITHYRLTSEEFFQSYASIGLPPIHLGFIDGNHAFDHVRHDFLAMGTHVPKNGYVFLHDTNITFREKLHHSGVKRWLTTLKKSPAFFEVIDFPFSSGVALVRFLSKKRWAPPQ